MKIRMKSGSEMDVECHGRVYRDGDGDPTVPGGTRSWIACDDFTAYWPRKPGKPLREIPPELYDYDDAVQRYIDGANDR